MGPGCCSHPSETGTPAQYLPSARGARYPASILPGSSKSTGIRSEQQTLHESNLSYFSLAGSTGLPTGEANGVVICKYPNIPKSERRKDSYTTQPCANLAARSKSTKQIMRTKHGHSRLLLALLSDAGGNSQYAPQPDTDGELTSGNNGNWMDMTATEAASTDSWKARRYRGWGSSGNAGAEVGCLAVLVTAREGGRGMCGCACGHPAHPRMHAVLETATLELRASCP